MVISKNGLEVIKHALKTGFYNNNMCPGDIADLVDTIETQQREIEQLKNQRDIWKSEFLKDSADYNETYKKLLIERDRLLQNVQQHIKWNEEHTRNRVILSEKNIRLKSRLNQAVQALTLIMNCNGEKEKFEFAQNKCKDVLYVEGLIGGDQSCNK